LAKDKKMVNKIYQLYLELLEKYGSPEKFWRQWCKRKKSKKDREMIALGAILTQRTSWHNARLSLENLEKTKLLGIKAIASLSDLQKLKKAIKPAGFYERKSRVLFNFCSFICSFYGNLLNFAKEDLEIARQKLLSISGIGPETADTILLYSLEKPVFVIDEYTKRLAKEKKLSKDLDNRSLKNLFEKNLPKDVKIYQDFHALIVIDQKGKEKSRMETF